MPGGILLLLGVLCTQVSSSENVRQFQSITVVSDDNYPPYIFRDASGQLQGILPDLWQLWQAKTGIRVELTGMDWARAQQFMKGGEADVIDTIFRTPEREKSYDFSKPYATLDVPIFFHRDISGIVDIQSLHGFKIGVKEGDACIEKLQEHGIDSIEAFPSYETLIRTAGDQKIKVFCIDQPPALYYLNKFGFENDFRRSLPLYSGQFHRAVHKGQTALLETIERGFARISNSEFNDIEKKWLGYPLRNNHIYARYLIFSLLAIVVVTTLLIIWNWALRRQVAAKTAELTRTLHTLKESESRFALFMDYLPAGVFIKDEEGRTLYVNQYLKDAFGAEAWMGKTAFEVFPKPIAAVMMADDRKAMDAGFRKNVETLMHLDGQVHVYETRKFRMLREGQGPLLGGIGMDITGQRKAEERLRQAMAVFENTMEGVMITDAAGDIIAVNAAFTDITGYVEAEALGHNPRLLKSGRHSQNFYQALWSTLLEKGHWQGEIWNRRRNGEIYPEWMTISSVLDSADQVVNHVAVFSDISRLKRSEAQLERLAHYDPLTDLPNRLLLHSRLKHALDRARRNEHRVAVLFMDLDRFKDVNDSLGHPVGDELLVAVSQRLRSRIREEDTLARFGGDEFLVVLESLQRSEDVATLAMELIRLLNDSFHLSGGHEVHIGASVGISVFPDDAQDANDLIRNADAAMYQAKEQGRNTFRFYTEALTRSAQERLHL